MTVKIINITHKKCFLPQSSAIITMHAGRKVALKKSKDGLISKADFNWLKANTLGDDTGENISYLNRYCNEMTCIYWVWKNYKKIGNPDSIGFMHYRRHFMLNDKLKIWGNYLDNLGLTESALNFYCQKYDLIHPPFMHMKNGRFIDRIGREFCVLGGKKIKQAIQIALDIIQEKYPQDFPAVKAVFEGYETGSFCNMFIMKKKNFFEYCEWIFPILFELDKRLDRDYQAGEERCIGWTAEMLTSVFIYLKAKQVTHKEVRIFSLERKTKKTKFDIFVMQLKWLFCRKDKKLTYMNRMCAYELEKEYKNQQGILNG